MSTLAFSLVILAGFAVHIGASVIESDNTISVEATRAALKASAYKFNLNNGIVVANPEAGFTARILILNKSPALGLRDVQQIIADGAVVSGGRFLRHFHPRSSELLYVIRGRMQWRIEFEDGTVAENVLRRGDILVIPQGLIHDAHCLSAKDCFFIAIFRTADPGLIPLPFRD